jgi:hypothetical protein
MWRNLSVEDVRLANLIVVGCIESNRKTQEISHTNIKPKRQNFRLEMVKSNVEAKKVAEEKKNSRTDIEPLLAVWIDNQRVRPFHVLEDLNRVPVVHPLPCSVDGHERRRELC